MLNAVSPMIKPSAALREARIPADGNGITYAEKPVSPAAQVRLDDDLVLWLTKAI